MPFFNTPKIVDRLRKSLFERHPRRPPQSLPRQCDVRLALNGVVGREGPEDDLRTRAGQSKDFFRQFQDGDFGRVSEIHRPGKIIGGIHEPDKTVREVVNITE
jgi:hypothetical protein